MAGGWDRLADAIRADRPLRYRTNADLARAAQLSERTIEDLTAGKRTSYRADTLHQIEAALGWEHGSAERVVGGGERTYVQDGLLAQLIALWPHLSVRDRQVILAVAEALRR